MKLKCVTITGADENTSIDEMMRLTRKYPFVEWGMLISVSRAGRERYPSLRWMKEMFKAFQKERVYANFSFHLCGKITRQMLSGRTSPESWDEYVPEFRYARRIQVNCNVSRAEAYDPPMLASLIRCMLMDAEHYNRSLRFIFQYNRNNELVWYDLAKHGVITDVLYDASGGRGKDPSNGFQRPISGLLTGYSGGFKPENVSQRLNTLQSIVGIGLTWIDMESGIRDERDQFSIPKVESVLDQSEEWVL